MKHDVVTILGVLAIVDLAQALFTAIYADSKGFSSPPVFLATLFLGFPLPVLLIALAPDHAHRR